MPNGSWPGKSREWALEQADEAVAAAAEVGLTPVMPGNHDTMTTEQLIGRAYVIGRHLGELPDE